MAKSKINELSILLVTSLILGGFMNSMEGSDNTVKPRSNGFQGTNQFLGATKHLYNWLCLSVGWLVCWSFGRVTHSFNHPHVAPYWPTWPCPYLSALLLQGFDAHIVLMNLFGYRIRESTSIFVCWLVRPFDQVQVAFSRSC